MGSSHEPSDPPDVTEVASLFDVYEIRQDGDTVLYIGEPTVPGSRLENELWPLFRDQGYEVSLQRGYNGEEGIPLSRGEYVLVAEPWSIGVDGVPWTNIVLFVATVLSTLFAGAFFWYQVPLAEEPWRALEAWPFVVAIMGVLGVHELGHYVMSRYHNVQASLPYFIPLPTYIGSMGAVIRMKGRIPDRKALFDIGAAGPLAGLIATVVVTAIGLQLNPLAVQQATVEGTGEQVVFNEPPLLEIIAELTGAGGRLESGVVHPVVFGGWVGMLVTLLNMLPVGQLDGGHILRAVVGERQRTIAAVVPGALFALAGYLLFIRDGFNSVGIWTMWGLFALGLAYAGPATPIDDEGLGWVRVGIAVLTFVLAALCFTPVPIEIVEAS
jgi:membrane-associated protease RseP (regulator of RpoE activity)